MPTITKNLTLQGVIHLNEIVPNDYVYNFSLPTQNYQTSLPYPLDNQVLEQVYIIVDHVHNTQIYLPLISGLKNSWGLKVFVLQNYASDPIPTLEVYPSGANTINGFPLVSFSRYRESKYLKPVEGNIWNCETSSLFLPPIG